MKKILTILAFMVVCITANAQLYKATSYAQKTYNYTYKTWTSWSDWYECSLYIRIDSDNDIINIDSSTPQRYKITGTMNYGKAWTDNSGGTNVGFTAIRTSDGHRCNIRLRVETNGNSQLYVEFSDAMWVYNVYRV